MVFESKDGNELLKKECKRVSEPNKNKNTRTILPFPPVSDKFCIMISFLNVRKTTGRLKLCNID